MATEIMSGVNLQSKTTGWWIFYWLIQMFFGLIHNDDYFKADKKYIHKGFIYIA